MLLKANTTDTILSYTNQNFLQTNKNDIIPSHKGVWAKPRKAMKTETITKTSYKTSRPHWKRQPFQEEKQKSVLPEEVSRVIWSNVNIVRGYNKYTRFHNKI